MAGESPDDARLAALAQAGLDWLAGDVEELSRFMAECGYSPDGLRVAIGTRPFAAAGIEYFARNEPQLLAMTANAGIATSEVMGLYWRLNPGGG